jgi:hypothetical protein
MPMEMVGGKAVFAASPNEPAVLRIGEEEADVGNLSLGTILSVFDQFGDDIGSMDPAKLDFRSLVRVAAIACSETNPNITEAFLLRQPLSVSLPLMLWVVERIAPQVSAAIQLLNVKNG